MSMIARLAAAGLLWAILGLARVHAAVSGFVLEVEAANPQGGNARLFYDVGQWYSVNDSCGVAMPPGKALQAYRFAIPAQPIKHLRFDPADRAAVVRIGRIRLLTAEGRELAAFGPERLVPMHSIAGFEMDGGVAQVTTGSDTPMLFIARPLQLETELALERRFVGPGQVLALAALVAALVAVGAVAAVRSLAASDRRAGWVLAGSFLLVFGARLFWLKHYSRPLPFWDEWETDGIDLLIPLKGGFLDWQALFIPQGEHRILVTRLLNLAGTICNGEWDPRVGMTAGALLYAASVSLLCAGASKAGPLRGLAAATAIALWSCLPFDVRNIYWGDQTQMYALNFMAVCVMAIAVSQEIGSLTWIGAAAAALASLFTMGSGFLAPAVAGALCVGRLRAEGARRLSVGVLGALFLAVAAIGVCMYRDAPYQGPDYARTWARFWPAFVSRSAWPCPPAAAWSLVVWVPWLAAGVCAAAPRRISPLNWFAVGVGALVLLDAAGLAHGRPSDLRPFDSKYFTVMSLVIAASVLGSSTLMARWPAHRALTLAVLAISLGTVAAMGPTAIRSIQGSRDQHGERMANEKLVREFLETGDPARLRSTPYWELPYWNGAELADLLDSPSLQPLLPAEIRASAAGRPCARRPAPAGFLTVACLFLMDSGLALFIGGIGVQAWLAASGCRKSGAAGEDS